MAVEPENPAAHAFHAFVRAELSALERRILVEYARQPSPVSTPDPSRYPGAAAMALRSAAASECRAWAAPPAPFEEECEHPCGYPPGLQEEAPTSRDRRTAFHDELVEVVSDGGQEGAAPEPRGQEGAAPEQRAKARRTSHRTSHRRLMDQAWGGDTVDFEEDDERERRAKASKGVPQSNLFGDLQAMKEEGKKPKYDVKNFYKDTGMWQQVARHSLFENGTLTVIAINALWMAVDCDNNFADSLLEADIQFQIAEQFFCFYFVAELVIRFQAFRYKRNCLRDAWFVFDSVLVTMMVFETWVMSIVMLAGSSGGSSDESPPDGGGGGGPPLGLMKLLRLARLSRLLRLLRSMPELLFLVKGMVAAMRSVGFVMLLLMLITYVFAIAFIQLLRDSPVGQKHFGWLGDAMYTLIMAGTLMDNITTIINELSADNFVCAVLFGLFVCLSALTVMNMLIGVLCEVVSSVAECEKEGMLITYVTGRFQEIWDTIDTDGTGTLSKKEFAEIISNPDALQALEEVDVDPISLVKMRDMIFEDEETGESKDLTLKEFMEVVLSFRGTNTATVKDLTDMRRFLDEHSHRRSDQDRDQIILEIKTYLKSIVGGLAQELGHNGFANKLLRTKTNKSLA